MFFNKGINFKNILFILLIIFLIWFIGQIQNTALLAFGSFVLACSLRPIVDKLEKHMKRELASTIVIIGAILGFLLFLVPIVTIALQEIHQLIAKVPQVISNTLSFLNNKTIMGKAIIEYIDISAITTSSSQFASGLVNKSINFTLAILEVITIVITMGVIVFYMVNEKNLIRNAVIVMFPSKLKSRAQEIYTNIENKVGGYVIAQVLSMSTVAIFTAIGLMFLNVEYALLLGLIAGILDIIPIVGPTLALILGLLSASPHGIIVVLLTFAIYMIAQWISNNFIRPLVFGKFLDLHPIIIIFSFLIAAQFLGVWGVILSPAIAALLLILFDELYLKTINPQKKDREEEIEK